MPALPVQTSLMIKKILSKLSIAVLLSQILRRNIKLPELLLPLLRRKIWQIPDIQ